MTSNCGVYEIRNTVNNKWYVGSSRNIKSRWATHKYSLRKGRHGNPHLQNAWNKYGEDAFEFNVLLICDLNNRIYYEQQIKDNLNPDYNYGECVESPIEGRHHTEHTRKLMSIAGKGRKFSIEHRKKIGEANSRRIIKDSTRLLRSVLSKGNTYCKGRILSDETKRKISESEKGKKLPKHQIEQIRNRMLGNQHTKGKKLSPEHLQALRDGWNKWRAIKLQEEIK